MRGSIELSNSNAILRSKRGRDGQGKGASVLLVIFAASMRKKANPAN